MTSRSHSHTIAQIPVQDQFQDRHLTVLYDNNKLPSPRQRSKSDSWNVLADNHGIQVRYDT